MSLPNRATAQQQYLVTPVAGGALTPTAALALKTNIGTPIGLAVDVYGNQFFIANNCVWKVDSSGIFTLFAGGSTEVGYTGDGGPATGANLDQPTGLAVDGEGNVYISETYGVREVAVDGTISTIAGSGATGGGNMQLAFVANVAVDGAGNTYFNDSSVRLFMLSASGVFSTVLNNFNPNSWTVNANGNVFQFTVPARTIEKVSTNGSVQTVAGNGTFGSTGDGGLAINAGFSNVSSLAVDSKGDLFVADTTSKGFSSIVSDTLIREVGLDGIIHTVGGNGSSGTSGDGGPALNAELGFVVKIACDAAGDVYLADSEYSTIREIGTNAMIMETAGSGLSTFGGDGGPALEAMLYFPSGVALDSENNLYVSDGNNQRIRKISGAGTITTVAGNGLAGYSQDGVAAVASELSEPAGLAVDASGNLYIADSQNNRVRKVAANGIISTVAGSGVSGFSGDGGAAITAQLYGPQYVALDGVGNLYILDNGNRRVRKVSTSGIISTVAGNGNFGSSGDGGPATSAEFSFGDPGGLAVDATGDLYIGDGDNGRLRKVDTAGIVSTLASGFDFISAVTLDGSGNVFVVDSGLVEQILPGGSISSISFHLDGPPTSAFSDAYSIAIAPNGSIYSTDQTDSTVQVFVPLSNPLLSISVTHLGNLNLGQSAATYLLTVSNLATTGLTSGAVNVAIEIPNGFTMISAAGPGWTCTNVCSRSDVLGAQSSYPPITLTANVSAAALSQVTFAAIVSGGGAPAARGVDLAEIFDTSTPSAPVLTAPANGAGDVGDSPVLSWTGSTNTFYDVYIGTTPTAPLVASVSGPSYTPKLSYGTAYYWKVVANSVTASATSVTSEFATDLKLQAVNFTAIAPIVYGASPIQLAATSTAGIPVTFSVVSGPATIAGNTLTITGPGVVTVQASAAASLTYTSAVAIQTFTVASPGPVIGGTLNAASYTASALTAGSLRSLFGQSLASQTVAATTGPLPTTLGGSSLSLVDGSGQTLSAQLLYVSPGQINFVVPIAANPGSGTLSVTDGAGVTDVPVEISEIDPGMFSINATGAGPAVGSALHLASSGAITYTSLASCGGTPVVCSSLPVAFGSPDERVFLVLYGTGIRGVSSLSGVTVTIAGAPLSTLFAGAQGQFAGLDQINAEVPRSLVGTGQTTVQVTVNGQNANALGVLIQ